MEAGSVLRNLYWKYAPLLRCTQLWWDISTINTTQITSTEIYTICYMCTKFDSASISDMYSQKFCFIDNWEHVL